MSNTAISSLGPSVLLGNPSLGTNHEERISVPACTYCKRIGGREYPVADIDGPYLHVGTVYMRVRALCSQSSDRWVNDGAVGTTS